MELSTVTQRKVIELLEQMPERDFQELKKTVDQREAILYGGLLTILSLLVR